MLGLGVGIGGGGLVLMVLSAKETGEWSEDIRDARMTDGGWVRGVGVVFRPVGPGYTGC